MKSYVFLLLIFTNFVFASDDKCYENVKATYWAYKKDSKIFIVMDISTKTSATELSPEEIKQRYLDFDNWDKYIHGPTTKVSSQRLKREKGDPVHLYRQHLLMISEMPFPIDNVKSLLYLNHQVEAQNERFWSIKFNNDPSRPSKGMRDTTGVFNYYEDLVESREKYRFLITFHADIGLLPKLQAKYYGKGWSEVFCGILGIESSL